MQSDSAYSQTCETNLRLLFQASGGEWASIPQQYLEYFHHWYSDGDISLLPAISSLENTDFLESWHVEEVVGMLSKVNPSHWPDLEDIVSIDAESFLSEESTNSYDYVEDNLGTAEKVEKVLKIVLKSTFGGEISSIRSNKGKYPSPENNFLQEEDGTFSGIFTHDNHQFNFEIAPTESGWLCTYRMTEKCLDNLEKPEFKGKGKTKKVGHRKIRNQSWR